MIEPRETFMSKSFYADGLPYEDQSNMRKQIRPPLKRLLAWYVDQTFNQGLWALNRRTAKFLEPNPDAVVLDVGTGDGETFLWWANKVGSKKLHAMDAVPNAHPDKIQTRTTSLDQAWPFESDMFHVVLSSQNIEHIIDTPLYMRECFRVLKPGGYTIILTENLSSWANIGATVLGWMPFSLTSIFGYPLGNKLVWHDGLPKEDLSAFYEKKLWGCLGHQRIFTLLALEQLGQKHGFTCEARFGSGYVPFWGVLSRLFSWIDPIHAHFIGIKLRKP